MTMVIEAYCESFRSRLITLLYAVFPFLFCFFCIALFLLCSISMIECYSIKQMAVSGREITVSSTLYF